MTLSRRRATPAAIALMLPVVSLTSVAATHPSAASTPHHGRVRHAVAGPSNSSLGVIRFSNGFETGNFLGWTLVRSSAGAEAIVERQVVKSGRYAAEFAGAARHGSFAFARKQLAAPARNITMSGDFRIAVEGAVRSNVPLLRLFDPQGRRLVSVYRQNHFLDQLWVEFGGRYMRTKGLLKMNRWGHVQLHVIAVGKKRSTVDITLNNRTIYHTTTASLGTSGVRSIQVGDEAKRQLFALYADNIVVRVAKFVPQPLIAQPLHHRP